MTTLHHSDTADTVADLLESLGDVPPQRVLLNPLPGHATEEDLLRLAASANQRLCELVDGTLVEKPMVSEESSFAAYLIELLNPLVRRKNLGYLMGEQGATRLRPRLVRVPDVTFTRWDRCPDGRRSRGITDAVPNLAVEVLCHTNRPAEMARKREEYFAAGVELYWEIDPEARVIDVYSATDQVRRLTSGDTLDGGTVLPEFSVPVDELFAELDRTGDSPAPPQAEP